MLCKLQTKNKPESVLIFTLVVHSDLKKWLVLFMLFSSGLYKLCAGEDKLAELDVLEILLQVEASPSWLCLIATLTLWPHLEIEWLLL